MEQLLIIEDDIGLNQGLCKALKADDRQIVSCHDLKTAREQLLCGSVSLILLDINLYRFADFRRPRLFQMIREPYRNGRAAGKNRQ